ncbi:hypothetical protein RA26_14720 [Leisingera sp. ANG-M7]|nr:hypothetical protein RA26_14720 [Leisingera sp. ANG-M7]
MLIFMSQILFVRPLSVAGTSNLPVYPCRTRLFMDFSKGFQAGSRGAARLDRETGVNVAAEPGSIRAGQKQKTSRHLAGT